MPSPTTTMCFLCAPLRPFVPLNPFAGREPFVPFAACVVSTWPSARFTIVVGNNAAVVLVYQRMQEKVFFRKYRYGWLATA